MDELARLLEAPLSSPLAGEIILVQSKGMERWVSLELANRQGICANVRFPFPNSYISEIFRTLVPVPEGDSPFAPERLCWKIMDILPGFLARPSFAGIRSYLGEGREDFKLYQLSRKIAEVFDRYLLFRPEMVVGWEMDRGGTDGGWQAELWRALSGELKIPHRAALLKAFLEEAEKARRPARRPGAPERISVFGVSALPLFHLRALAAAARFTDVHLFVTNPCREYWGDIMSGRDISRVTRQARARGLAGDLHLDKGNSLLASMGMLGRDFFDMLQQFDFTEEEAFAAPGRRSLLNSVQSDILELRDGPPEEIPGYDKSIEVHSCHSPLREVEVLQDNLLALFEARPDIRPRDVLVMMPDINSYAPFIDAVFSLPREDSRMVPFRIADKGMGSESPVVGAFLGLIEISRSRLGAARVMEVLESAEVREKFSLTEPDVETVRGWVRDARIRWGLDEGHREGLGIPGFAQNTWRAGLDRMLLGYALPERDGALFAGALPFDGVEGSASDILGRFLAFADRLFRAALEMEQDRTLAEWSEFLCRIIDDFFPARGDLSPDLDFLRGAVLELSRFGQIMGRRVDTEIVRDHLRQRLDVEGFGGGFLSGGITFCAVLPMRSIPFKVICLLGMDDGAYPRESAPPGFDLMAREPRPGDRSRRLDDRYLFLEALLCAREKLYLSYVGQDIRDNSARPPSVLVSELLDYLAGRYGASGITVRHALQAFSPRYFEGGELFSYSRENFAAARALAGPRLAPGFFTAGISEPEPQFRTVSLDELCRFFGNPSRFLLTRRLGLFLEDRAEVLDEREPFSVEGLDRYALESALLEKALRGESIRGELERFRAAGLIPAGTPGLFWFEDACGSLEQLAGRIVERRAGRADEPVNVDIAVGGFRLTGTIAGIYPGGLVLHRPRDSRRNRLEAWITHLALGCALAEAGRSLPGSVLCTRQCDSIYDYPEDILGRLEELLDLYWQGLRRPLPFFPQTSWAYAEAEPKDPDRAEENALGAWEGTDNSRGDLEDPYIRRCFSESDLLENPEFRDIAGKVIGPVLEHGEFKRRKTE